MLGKNYRITKNEVKNRMGYVFIGIFGFYLATPAREWLDTLPLNKWIIGIGGILLTLLIFKFD